jgi:protein-disulfide isomerase
MTNRPVRAYLVPALLFACTAALVAQEWQTVTTLPGVELKGLTPGATSRALHALRAYDCTCGCGMKVAECRIKDPGCAYSKGIAATVVESLRKGKSEAAAVADAKASRFGQKREPKTLDDAVAIPTAGAPAMGPAGARITLVEFSDFQCPYCSRAVHKLAAILQAYPADVKLVFKQYPLDSHPQAQISAQAAVAAHQQGKFWQLHDIMFANPNGLSRKSILGWAASIGLDMKKFEADLDSDAVKKTVARDQADGDKAGVEGTPTVFINGQRYNGEYDLAAIKPILDAELKRVSGAKK